jgi:hypothetical protein
MTECEVLTIISPAQNNIMWLLEYDNTTECEKKNEKISPWLKINNIMWLLEYLSKKIMVGEPISVAHAGPRQISAYCKRTFSYFLWWLGTSNHDNNHVAAEGSFFMLMSEAMYIAWGESHSSSPSLPQTP